MKCDIEIYSEGMWRKAASFTLQSEAEIGRGVKGAGFFEYDVDYAAEYLNDRSIHAVSCLLPVDFEFRRMTVWPSFLLDILPSGANRDYFLKELALPNTPAADWNLLLKGGGNPPGNIRIAQAAANFPTAEFHHGFSYEEIIDRAEYFIEYAKENNAPVAGSSGAQGDAPKFLLTQDHKGRFHADGALPDHLACKHWLVKFPRGKKQSDRDILRNEAAYYKVAQALGAIVGENLFFDSDALFTLRFDRKAAGKGVIRMGLESLASLSSMTDFGARAPMEALCGAIARFSSHPHEDIMEFVFRDILNVAMGNTDNHARNTALIKHPDGNIRIAPLYDFAPMFLDDQGIARTCRWTDAETMGTPDWRKVAQILEKFDIAPEKIRASFADYADKVKTLPDLMDASNVDLWLIERLLNKIDGVYRSLENV